MVEFGGRFAIDDQTILRPYASVGVSFQPDNRRVTDSSFVGALPADGHGQA